MAQKFTSLEEAADQLGISKDLLTQLREAGKVRAYRDGAVGSSAAKISNGSRPRASRNSIPARAIFRSTPAISRNRHHLPRRMRADSI